MMRMLAFQCIVKKKLQIRKKINYRVYYIEGVLNCTLHLYSQILHCNILFGGLNTINPLYNPVVQHTVLHASYNRLGLTK